MKARQAKSNAARALLCLGICHVHRTAFCAQTLSTTIRALKAERDGEIDVAGPLLARSFTELGLVDEYRIYLHSVVLGRGTPYFAGPVHGSVLGPVIGLTRT